MRRLGMCSLVTALLLVSSAPVASAAVRGGAGPTTARHPTGCRKVSYTADGGYYSAGNFYWEPGDDVTLTTHWCFGGGLVTSYAVTYTTTIPAGLDPRFLTNESVVDGGAAVDVELNGDYDTGVLNNVGFVGIAGLVRQNGHHRFADTSDSGG